ncbi:MAG: tRNA1(Val) (adenine(37)-N6)-methyltransferase [Clostridiaceae bacterium]
MGNKSTFINEDETVDDLELKGLNIIQKKKGFKFGTDAVLLSHFSEVKSYETVIDLCTGSGIVPILISGKSDAKKIFGLEIQSKYAEMAVRSVKMNELEDRVTILQGDIKDLDLIKSLGKFSVVTANPPYKALGSGIIKSLDELTIARHEVEASLEDVIKAADMLLTDTGRLVLVHRPERLLDIVTLMRKYKIEPKRLQAVAPYAGKAPNIILIEGKKNQKPYLKWEKQIEIYEADGEYTDTIKEIYGDSRHG